MKTKTILTAMLLSAISYSAFAQLETDAPQYEKVKPKYKWSISAAINSVEAQMDQMLFNTWEAPYTNYYSNYGNKQNKSLSLSIIPKYQIADNIFLRFEFGITNIDLRSHFNGIGDTLSQNQGQALGSAKTIGDQVIQQKIYRYAPGIQWNFMKKKFIETYCGASLNYFYYSKMNWSLEVTDSPPNGRGTDYTSTTPGGFATGISAFTGFNIYLQTHISLGGEFAYSILYYKLGGVESGSEEQVFPYILPNGSNSETFYWKNYNNASKGIEFSKVMPSLNVTIRF